MSAVHELIDRLNRGWMLCNREPDPAHRSRLEDYWILLLKEYERACNRSTPGATP